MTTEPERQPIDKSAWGDGPWTSEPDRAEWEHAGLPCLALRGPEFSGHWCGYVAVPPGHPMHGKGYSEEVPALAAALDARMNQPLGDNPSFAVMLACLSGTVEARADVVLNVHGGLTYANKCSGKICHVPKSGEPDDVWWFGFDCAHAGDFQPAYHAKYKNRGYPFNGGEYDHARALAANDWSIETYRTLDYVREQANSLADQLASLSALVEPAQSADAVDPGVRKGTE